MKGRMFDPRIGRFTTTDPVIADIWDGQSLNRYAYVRNNPLALVDPTGFVPQDLDDEPSGSWRTTLDPPIFNGPEQDSYTYGVEIKRLQEAPKTGAHAPPVDVNTTGNGGEGLPLETTPPEPKKGGLLDGLRDGLSDTVDDIWRDWTTTPLPTINAMREAYRHGDVIDAFNVVNPLLAFIDLGLAIEKDDDYAVARQSVRLILPIVGAAIVGKVVSNGTRKTRGPPQTNEVRLARSKYPETTAHIRDAQAAGHPTELTIDRPGARGRRAESLAGRPKVPGMDLDEYPPAMFKEGGKGASVRPVTAAENRGAGACMGNQCRAFPNGTRVKIIVE
jgi:hypothetical protein